jgi:hypothetical protein
MPGWVEDFIDPFKDWQFDWLDVPDLTAGAEFILEYPMVDRDPVDKWSHGRVTLLGDAAHPMYPRGGNGGAQAILDAEIIARLLDEMDDPIAALQIYENERLAVTNNIVMTNRAQSPDVIIAKVEELTGGEPFERLEDIIDPAELIAISESYKNTAGYSLEKVESAIQ